MAVTLSEAPLTRSESVIKGLLSGLMIGGGLFSPGLVLAAGALLLALGIVIFLDAVMPSSKYMNGFTVFVSMLAGCVAMFALSITGNSPVFILIAMMLAVLLYLRSILTGLHILRK